MRNFTITTLIVVTLTILAGDAHAQSSFLGLGNLFPWMQSGYGNSYTTGSSANGRCSTTGYPSVYNNTGYYGNSAGTGYYPNSTSTGYYPNSTGNGYYNTYPAYTGYGQGSYYGTRYQPAAGTNAYCPNGRCTTPAYRPATPYQTYPYAPGGYSGSPYNYGNTNNTNAPYYGSY